MKNKITGLSLCMFLLAFVLAGCSAVRNAAQLATSAEPVIVVKDGVIQEPETESTGETEAESEPELQTAETLTDPAAGRTPVKVKGLYISAYVAGTPSLMDELIARLDETEANALVIDIKDDYGRVAFETESPLIQDVGSVKLYIPNAEELTKKLHDHGIYVIARIPAFRDAWLGDARPDWCVKLADGSVYRDRDGNAWVNPYRKEAWEYLAEIGREAKRLGFDEVQFDYVRFCTEAGMRDAVFDPAEVQNRSRTDIILDCMDYLYENLKAEGLFVSADVFGAIIGSNVNAQAVGQIYGELAKHLDYISPMVYPSHYGDGNFGIDHPDIHPYETISAALLDSRKELYFAGLDGGHVAEVRPWLQDFTAAWLPDHLDYGAAEVRSQIQATYDSGYDEWMLWDASCRYSWDGLLSPEDAGAEALRIAESRAALPETVWAEETAAQPETGAARPGTDASSSDGSAAVP